MKHYFYRLLKSYEVFVLFGEYCIARALEHLHGWASEGSYEVYEGWMDVSYAGHVLLICHLGLQCCHGGQ